MKVTDYQSIPAQPVEMEDAETVSMRMLISEQDGAPFRMRLFDVQSDGHTPLHTHDFEHEVFVLEGQGSVWREGVDVPLEPGTVVFVPSNEKHQFKNTGDSVFRFLCLVPISG